VLAAHGFKLDTAYVELGSNLDALRWQKLIRLCGYLGDSSQTLIKFWQDDATNSVHIIVGGKSYYGSSFESVIDKIPEFGA
jgi:hypothetical protein